MRFSFPCWYDLHVHFRQGPAMAAYIAAHAAMGCVGALAMPNTKPPVAKVFESDDAPGWSIESYRAQLMAAGADVFTHLITPLYLTKDTTPDMIEKGAKAGLLHACKYYPPHGTTNADHGRPLETYLSNGVIAAMADHDVRLLLHGEEHGLTGPAYFDRDQNAEDVFYREQMPRLRDSFPTLKITGEHITTQTAVNFIKESGSNVAASITPQHLLYTVGHLVQGLKYHLYCLPLVKFEEDRQALLNAVLDNTNSKFFAGTDSAPHTTKATPCGCAAGCFTGGIAPQLYARAFDLNNNTKDAFERFLCLNGPRLYDLPIPDKTFTLIKHPAALSPLETPEGVVMPLPLGLKESQLEWTLIPA